ncbi:MLO-like protein 9 [Typha angustifolia]|uniref:MLO-like protein 9 n=1 Tax=Typha angustifolia TaxID=59011 RepID=UPI003C30828A
MAGGGDGNSRQLDQTPTWAVAVVCAVIIIVSILLDKGLHHLGEWFTEKRKKAMFEALEKIQTELMILGFISLLLTFGQRFIVKICIPEKVAETMLPCRIPDDSENGDHRRRLLWNGVINLRPKHRILASETTVSSCDSGKVPLISLNGIHQLHIFIFFLAVFHVAYSAITMALGGAKIRKWKEWEKETSSPVYEFSTDPSRFRFAEDVSFVKQHTSFWNRATILLYIVSFFRQFFRSVRKTDYLAMRHGFINVHLAPGSKFNFQKYIKRSLEDDFKVVVGISPLLWACALINLLLGVNGWQGLFWVSLAPPIIILVVGTKLQAIITKMAIDIQEKHSVIQGIPLVNLSDHHFWFGRPQLVLFLIHFTLFQNAFQLTYFFWIWYDFGLRSCFHENFNLIIIRVCLGVGVQILCSYITLPLYALVSQMGTHLKKSIFDYQTTKALKKWHESVKKKRREGSSHHSSRTPGTSPGASPNASPLHQLYRYKTIGHTGATSTPTRSFSDVENSDTEMETPLSSTTAPNSMAVAQTEHRLDVEENRIDPNNFSFSKPSQTESQS